MVTQLHSSTDLIVKFAEPIAQIIPRKREDMVPIDIDNDIFNSLCKDRHSERGDGGFGSSKDVKLIIYKIINKINKKIYIGQTTRTLEERKKSYKYEKGRPIAHAIKKYGFENFDFMAGDEVYKSEWANQSIVLEDNFFGLSAKGKLYAHYKYLKLNLKKKLKNNQSAMVFLRRFNIIRRKVNDILGNIGQDKKIRK